MDFKNICDTLANSPAVSAAFSHSNVAKYIEIIALLKPTPVLAFLQPSHQISVPPLTLPVAVHEFLKDCFGIPDETGKLAWEAFRVLAWSFNPSAEEQEANRIKHVQAFLQHGLSRELGMSFRTVVMTIEELISQVSTLYIPLRGFVSTPTAQSRFTQSLPA